MNAVGARTIGSALQRVRDAYPRQPFTDATQTLYAQELADLDDGVVYEAVCRIIRTSEWFPTVAAIRAEVAEMTCALPTIDEAWAMVTNGLKVPVPEVRASLMAVGGPWEVMHADNPTTVRAQFVKDYESRRARVIREVAIHGPQNGRALPMAQPPAVTAATVSSLAEYRLRDLPESTRMTIRPIVWRTVRREAGRTLDAPSELEQGDAIRWLATEAHDDTEPIYLEAFRVLDECGRGPDEEA